MKKYLGGFFILIFFNITLFGLDLTSNDAMKFSTQGMLAQKAKLNIIAENIANATTLETENGTPYKKKYAILKATAKGVKVASIKESTKPFNRVYDPGNPLADKNGFVYLPNVNLAEEMTQLSMTNILYEANTTAYKSGKAMFQQSLELLK